MKKGIACLLLMLPLLAMSQEIALDTENTKVTFEFVSDNVSGTVGGVDASIVLNPLDLGNSTVKGSADVSTLSTGNKMRDKHLKSDDFFNAEEHPKMLFSSSSITKKGENYLAEGTLTIGGVSKDVTFEITVTASEMVFSATINADDFNVSPKSKEKSEVKVNVSVPLG